jgi:acetyl-CoA synthetase
MYDYSVPVLMFSQVASMSAEPFLTARDFLLKHRVDYATAVEGFRWPSMSRFNWALDYIDVMAVGNRRRALVVVEEDGTRQERTFEEISKRSGEVASFFRSLGMKRGDRLLLMLGNEVALWETFLACMKLGIVVVPATTLLAGEDIRDRMARGQIAHVVAGADSIAKFSGISHSVTRICVGEQAVGWHNFDESATASSTFMPDAETHRDDPLLLYFTSGTTAKPKLVLHTHQTYPVGHLSTMYWLGLQPGDVHWNISSPGWAKHAWSCIFAPWNAGATVFAFNYRKFQSRTILAALVNHGVTTLCAPPTVWRMLVQEPLTRYNVSLREVASAGEPLNPEVIEQVKSAWGLTIRDGFGQTETTALIGNPPGQPIKLGSMGRPLPGYTIELINADGAAGDEGEICINITAGRGGLMGGYADSPNKTAEVTSGHRYRTGDVAMRDEGGYITYVGRADDVFKASDYRISPFELESVLIEHPAVAEAAVVPSPDPLRQSVPKAFVTLVAERVPSADLAHQILEFCRGRLAPYQRIRRLEFCELPKTISGKIRRVELRRQEAERRAAGTRVTLEFFEEDF